MAVHHRRTDHFGTQPDTTITTTEALGPIPAGSTLDEVLIYLVGRLNDLTDYPFFGVAAYVEPYFALNAVIQKEQTASSALDAWIAYGESFGIDATFRDTEVVSFGISAYLIEAG